ncbi:hypothetical protein [Rhizobium beringeri]|uniref:hypothetical protein n=1 Tax=Rhizobium beringeri TaxID=3019934 RepID=UPI003B5A7110
MMLAIRPLCQVFWIRLDGPVAKFIADGAYDGAPTRDLLETRFGEIVEIIIPPPKTAV